MASMMALWLSVLAFVCSEAVRETMVTEMAPTALRDDVQDSTHGSMEPQQYSCKTFCRSIGPYCGSCLNSVMCVCCGAKVRGYVQVKHCLP
mmetsp:Transcript_71951/g.206576  ORF Transcript_71951/g.206576 Transcript_71951/m.206576 type:complete len:91 (-) Transcript_71951:189-461(-)|eukprot:CAMPEP_0177183772 /NCGR_PEP_ID=MMETSP0367-20130122/17196_1 /TAXON_ID=447022 ORGANISM="Scrippsiella hangoei-like, Strain SHHI-4" /NCGR_SAMPLE_ID=MMETSP0367 /ASSEMBLY_ACC=CAM_ASM_000362 /LENGTH=90 /DNA_ID=CAMNT_0018630831 /DNA_START=81 /DNA_END=353 /DNA_ORIENTATION=-